LEFRVHPATHLLRGAVFRLRRVIATVPEDNSQLLRWIVASRTDGRVLMIAQASTPIAIARIVQHGSPACRRAAKNGRLEIGGEVRGRSFLSVRADLDFADLFQALRVNPEIHGKQAYKIIGKIEDRPGDIRHHSFHYVNDNVAMYIQDWVVRVPFLIWLNRSRRLCFNFVKDGNYKHHIGDQTSRFLHWMMHIVGAPESRIEIPSGRPQKIVGVALVVEREYLFDVLGLRVGPSSTARRLTRVSAQEANEQFVRLIPHAIALLLDEILESRLVEPLRTHFLRAKAMELLCATIAQLNASKSLHSDSGLAWPEMQKRRIAAAALIFRQELHKPISISALAQRVGLNRNSLTEGFSSSYGLSPHQYLIKQRMERALSLIEADHISLAEIAASCGYANYPAFSRAFSEYFGMSPSQRRKIHLESR